MMTTTTTNGNGECEIQNGTEVIILPVSSFARTCEQAESTDDRFIAYLVSNWYH